MGAEPGLDASKATLDDMKDPVKVQVVDWSADKVIQRRFQDGDAFLRWFEREDRGEWVKARWINVDGLNWEVAKVSGSFPAAEVEEEKKRDLTRVLFSNEGHRVEVRAVSSSLFSSQP